MATKAENIHNWLGVESYLINRETLCLLLVLVLAGALINSSAYYVMRRQEVEFVLCN